MTLETYKSVTYCMHYIASVAVTISPLLLKVHSRHPWAVYCKCAEIHRVHFIDYNKLWCLISFPLWVGFSSLFPQSYFVICLLCFLFEFCFGANAFLFMLKCNKLPTFHRTCSKPFFTTHKTLSSKHQHSGHKYSGLGAMWGLFWMFVQINKTMYVTLKQYYFQLPNLFWQFFFCEKLLFGGFCVFYNFDKKTNWKTSKLHKKCNEMVGFLLRHIYHGILLSVKLLNETIF